MAAPATPVPTAPISTSVSTDQEIEEAWQTAATSEAADEANTDDGDTFKIAETGLAGITGGNTQEELASLEADSTDDTREASLDKLLAPPSGSVETETPLKDIPKTQPLLNPQTREPSFGDAPYQYKDGKIIYKNRPSSPNGNARSSGSGGGSGGGGGSVSRTTEDRKKDVEGLLAGTVPNWSRLSEKARDGLLKKYTAGWVTAGKPTKAEAESALTLIYSDVSSDDVEVRDDSDNILYHRTLTESTGRDGSPILVPDETSDIDNIERTFGNKPGSQEALAYYELTIRPTLRSPEKRRYFSQNIKNPQQILDLRDQAQIAEGRGGIDSDKKKKTTAEKEQDAEQNVVDGDKILKDAESAVKEAREAYARALNDPTSKNIEHALEIGDKVTTDLQQKISDAKKADPAIDTTDLEAQLTAHEKNVGVMTEKRDQLHATRDKYKAAEAEKEKLLEAMRQGDIEKINEHSEALTGKNPGLTQDNLTSEGLDARKATLEKKKDVIDAEAAAKRAPSDAKATKLKDDLKLGTDVAGAAIEYGTKAQAILDLGKNAMESWDTLTRRDETVTRMTEINSKLMEFMSGTLSAVTAVTSETIAQGFTTLREAANPEKKELTATQQAAHDRAYDSEARTAQLEARTARMSVSDDIETKEAEVEKTEAERDKLKAEAQAKWYKENPKYG